ncbi:uncharacterized protein LOC143238760 isoform X2 [Tachypleus tridentatus]|uniref:uncharacterized protein LOC143238760 isoform X2 n=1 Tax=Tachypleus tridentatus TaxID=6853 RepID=UPI003FD5D909
MMNASEKQNKSLTTKSTLRRFTEHIKNGNVEKIEKFLSKGLDPNIQCPDTKETPLTLATTLRHPRHVIIALINGGACLDFTTSDGLTALHRAVEANNIESLKTLLDLGASPNYKDNRKLTPLYYSVVYGSDHRLTELLLYEHAVLGTADLQGWQEVHQACKHGRVQHLELLLFYGADLNCQNASGNTALHICAVNDQQECAQVLLSRGVNKEALNYANQDPYQVAVIAGNFQLAELIKSHKTDDFIPYRDTPRFNPRRRPSSTIVRSIAENKSAVGFKHRSSLLTSTNEPKTLAKEDVTQDTKPVGISECGLLEGRLANGQEGLFPPSCVQESKPRVEKLDDGRQKDTQDMLLRRVHSMPRKWKMDGSPRTVVLHKGKKGFGFVLRGAKATSPLMERQRAYAWPSLQYLDDVDRGGVADQAGMKKGDFVLEVNGHNITQATHDQVVSIIRQSGDVVTMTVVTVNNPPETKRPLNQRQCSTVPRRMSLKKAPTPPKRDPGTTLSFGRARARSMVTGLADIDSLEDRLQDYYFECRSARSSFIVSAEDGTHHSKTEQQNLESMLQRSRYVTKSSSEEPSRMDKELEILLNKNHHFLLQKKFNSCPELAKTSKCAVNNKKYICKRTKSFETFFSFSDKNHVHSWACPPHNYRKNYRRSAEIGKVSSGNKWCLQSLNINSEERNLVEKHIDECKFPLQTIRLTNKEIYLAEERHSLPWAGVNNLHSKFRERNNWPQSTISRMEEARQGVYAETMLLTKPRRQCPPPSGPPPPPPHGQVVRVDISRVQGEYANVAAVTNSDEAVMSSFRPGDSAKLYASPESLITVGYKPLQKSRIAQHTLSRGVVRPQSVQPRVVSHQTSSESESSGDASGFYGKQSSAESGTARYLRVRSVLNNRSTLSSPNHYPLLSPKPQDQFSTSLEIDSSEEEDISSFLNKTGKLSTFGKADESTQIYGSCQVHPSQVDYNRSIFPCERYSFDFQKYMSKDDYSQSSNNEAMLYNDSIFHSFSGDYTSLNQKYQLVTPKMKAQPTYQSRSYPYTDIQKMINDKKEHFDSRSGKSAFEPVRGKKTGKSVYEPVYRSSTLPNRRSVETDKQYIISNIKTIRPSYSFPNNLAKEDREEHELSLNDQSYVLSNNDYINYITKREVQIPSQIGEPIREAQYKGFLESVGRKSQQKNVSTADISSKPQILPRNTNSSSSSLLQFLPPPSEFVVLTPSEDHLSTTISPPPEFSDGMSVLKDEGKEELLSQHDWSPSHSNSTVPFLEQPASNHIEMTTYSFHTDGPSAGKSVPSHKQHSLPTSTHVAPGKILSSVLSSRQPTLTKGKDCRRKPLQNWSITDVSDWLDSLRLSEYKSAFMEAGINGPKLANMDNNDLVGLGVKLVSHRINILRSMKRYQKMD